MKIRSILWLLVLMVAFSCQNEDECLNSSRNTNVPFDINTDLLRLKGDSTTVAGCLKITANVPEVYLKWNVTRRSNLDTTQIRLSVVNGECILPIKWRESTEGRSAPVSVAFDAGVLITAGNDSKYVHLVWADKCDSVKIRQNSSLSTRAGTKDVMPKANEIIFTPPVLMLDKTTGGEMAVNITSGNIGLVQYPVEVDQYFDTDPTNLPARIMSETVLKFYWKGALPTESILLPIEVSTPGGLSSTGYVQYIPADIVWVYTGSIPATTQTLPATGATLKVSAVTNDKWEIFCTEATPTKVEGVASTIGNKDLILNINDNTSEVPRTITVEVSNAGVVKETLEFTQEGKAPYLDYVGSDLPAFIPKEGNEYTFDFTGTYLGNLQIRAKITQQASTETVEGVTVTSKNPTITIPANLTATTREIEFQYKADGDWVNIEYRIQEAGDATVTPGPITPPYNPIPDTNFAFSCIFTGNYTGQILFRARRGDKIYEGTEGVVGEGLTVEVPAMTSKGSQQVIFEYSINNGANWMEIESRMQNSESFTISPVSPTDRDISAEAQSFSVTIKGDFSNSVIFSAIGDDKKELASAIGKASKTGVFLQFTLPANTGEKRSVTFRYSLNDGEKWQVMEVKYQAAGRP